MTLPNFFIVGAPRCGTTALYNYLRTHPNIYMASYKEPHYFASDLEVINRLWTRSLEEYTRLFERSTSEHKAIGEASVFYLYSRIAIENIYTFNKDSKIIAMLRNPIDMDQSMHARWVTYGSEDEPDFEKAWRREISRRRGNNSSSDGLISPLFMYTELPLYSAQIERLYRTFPKDQIMIILYEDFKQDPQKIYEDVLKYLDVPSDERTNFQTINPTISLRSRWLYEKIMSLRRSTIIDKIIARVKHWMKTEEIGILRYILKFLTKEKQKEPLSPAFRTELIEYFRGDVQKLSALIERDLSNWLE